MVKHVMLRQRLLLSGKFDVKKERNSRVGYILDYDASPLTQDELILARVSITVQEIHQLADIAYQETVQICKDLLHMPVPSLPFKLAPLAGVSKIKKAKAKPVAGEGDDEDTDEEDDEDTDDEVCEADVEVDVDAGKVAEAAALDAARYASLCEDFDALSVVEAKNSSGSVSVSQEPTSIPSNVVMTSLPVTLPPIASQILDKCGVLSVRLMLSIRKLHQSGTATRSERTKKLDSKFTKPKETRTEESDDDETKFMFSIQEASHRVRVVQALDVDATRVKTEREVRWQTTAKAVEKLSPNSESSFISFCSKSEG